MASFCTDELAEPVEATVEGVAAEFDVDVSALIIRRNTVFRVGGQVRNWRMCDGLVSGTAPAHSYGARGATHGV